MAFFNQWTTPSIDKGWAITNRDKENNRDIFELELEFDALGRIKQQSLAAKIPDGTLTLCLCIKDLEEKDTERNITDRYVDLHGMVIPHSVVHLVLVDSLYLDINVVYQGHWIPSSVTMVSVPSLPFVPVSLIPESVRYLRVLNQRRPIEIGMVPSTIEHLYLCLERFPPPLAHDLPNSINELVVYSLLPFEEINIRPTFTAPIHVLSKYVYDRQVIDKLKLHLNIKSATFIDTQVGAITLPPTLTALVIEKGINNNSLSALHPLPPQLKYLSLPSSYQHPIYQHQYLPTSTTHLELSLIVTSRYSHFTNNWLGRIGYLPRSITHIKINILFGDDDSRAGEDSLPSGMKIVLPSSIQAVCLVPDNNNYRHHITIIDSKDYYSTTPTPPKIRDGLKELVVPFSFNQIIETNTLPTTLQSLSILNTNYKHPLNSDNIPTSLTSFTCNCYCVQLDLSAHESIKDLAIDVNSVIKYPPNLESLHLKRATTWGERDDYLNIVNKDLIKKVVLQSFDSDRLDQFLSLGLPSLEYLKSSSSLKSVVQASVQELDISDIYCTCQQHLLPTIKDIHLQLNPDILKAISLPTASIGNNDINYVSNQGPMVDSFFKLWRNVYMKSRILDSMYDTTKSTLRLNIKTGTLDHMDRFKDYNIIIDHVNQFVPDLLHFNKADQIDMEAIRAHDNLAQEIPKSIKRIKTDLVKGVIPDWITHLSMRAWKYLRNVGVGEIPPSVTNLTVSSKFEEEEPDFSKIPSSVRFLTLDRLKSHQARSIPASITHLTLVKQPIISLDQIEIPETVAKIELKSLVFQTHPKDDPSYDIPFHVARRLVNGVYYIYSKSKNRTAIPNNTTHLFWLDGAQHIDNNDVAIPSSVHTLVLGEEFNAVILSLPSTITQMVFNGVFKPVDAICFPPHIKYLRFSSASKVIEEHHLPKGLTHLVVDHYVKIASLPQSVRHLQFLHNGYDGVIPPQVQRLKVESRFGTTYIPPTIKSFITSSYDKVTFDNTKSYQEFTQEKIILPFTTNANIHLHALYGFNTFIMPHSLGNNIKSISLGNQFNQVILPGTFPNSVEHFEFGNEFNQALNKSLLPPSLQTLALGRDFNQPLDDLFPPTLTELSLNMTSMPSISSSTQFPPNLKKLAIPWYDGVLDVVPTTVNHLEFNANVAQKGKDKANQVYLFPIESLPPHITKLVLNDSMCIQGYNIIPPTIKSIKLCHSIAPGTKIPNTIESVVLPSSFNQPLDTILQTVDDQ
ncbi:hypothetical protein CYY_009997 [Polysphondylium violaceum]|uniref:FNIP repeat-containing protein n=1 Tax=Polysphondylium violaceum TaxID=133409 RepID=A0A8J4PK82_9MYCE|nr:hypothetical protein CYY_009997 [Polysphondylium violaceum]